MNGVEQGHGLLCLVGLQRPDQVQGDARIGRNQCWPLRLGFLHAILAENALSGRDYGHDRLGLERFGHRDQRYRGALAARLLAGAHDLMLHIREPVW